MRNHRPRPGAPGRARPRHVLAAAGGHADLFDVSHYPVQAVCRVCQQPISAETFLRAFEHDSDA